MAAVRSYCRRLRVPLIVALIVGCLGSCSSGTGAPTSDASSSAGTQQQLVAAFDQWERLPSTCQAIVKPNTLKMATVHGVEWAIAGFTPPPICYRPMGSAAPGGPPQTMPEANISPWGEQNPIGVFERQPGAVWVMNEEGERRFHARHQVVLPQGLATERCPRPRLRPGICSTQPVAQTSITRSKYQTLDRETRGPQLGSSPLGDCWSVAVVAAPPAKVHAVPVREDRTPERQEAAATVCEGVVTQVRNANRSAVADDNAPLLRTCTNTPCISSAR